jgi:hypothetical protein
MIRPLPLAVPVAGLCIAALLGVTAPPVRAEESCNPDDIARKLSLAEQARFWASFWDDLDDREARVELCRSRAIYAAVRRQLDDPACAGDERLAALAEATRRGQSWADRTLRIIYRPGR